ncbi:MAG: dihydrofolate reductase [Ruminococcus sp.]|uniref:dihydrofolate reductase n=1 Tax=Ruminococcus sp. TaxID=41978 RepID=UPI0025F72A85|nr:dihydrofolate reductase [Ruminococcus sp.]MCR4796376.1 dihydrofolate reductase [Ruminococcus sp.]
MINIIAAVAANGVIGCKGKMPWDIPEDRAYFRKLTKGNICIMGRHTYESVGRPLPERINIIVSSSQSLFSRNLRTVRSFDEAVKLAQKCSEMSGGEQEIFICGGRRIYAEALDMADRLYLTELDRPFEGTVMFPDFDKSRFELVEQERRDDLGLSFSVYEKKK